MTCRRWLSIFAATLIATAILLTIGLLYAMKIVEEPGYPVTTSDPAVAIQDNAFRWHDRPCDILVYGDSSANVGIDPRVITAQTGRTACNIATNRPIVDTLDTLPVDEFLAHNPKPKLLVFQFSPDTFYRSRTPWQNNTPYSPLLILSRDMPRATALRTMFAHPSETTAFLLFVLQRRFFPHHFDNPNYQHAIDHAEASNGQLDLNLPPETSCATALPKLFGPADAAWIRGLHRKYEDRGIPVIVRAAPIADCDPRLNKFQSDLTSFLDGPVVPLPVHLFASADRHTTQEGSQAETLSLIPLIQSRLAHNP